ncbi:MAG: hypothetical protein ACKOTA_06315, partial [Solirubrobacterales bacterium]
VAGLLDPTQRRQLGQHYRLCSGLAEQLEARVGVGPGQQQPIDPGMRFDYLDACDPVEVDVTLLSIADRLATRGRKADEAIAAHMEVATPMLGAALDWRRDGRPRSPLPGDELAQALELEPGPRLGELLAGVERAVYTGEVQDPDGAVAWARSALSGT